MECVFQIEKDKYCNQVLQRWWPSVPRQTDISAISAAALPKADLFCGGFPCQNLSVAGKRAGLSGKQSKLFFEFTRLVETNNPRWIVVENVPGLMSSHKGKDMGTVVGTLEELGYGVCWRVLNLQHFGVPQRRRRLFIVGCLGDLRSSAEVLFDPASLRRDSKKSKEEEKEIARTSRGDSRNRDHEGFMVGFAHQSSYPAEYLEKNRSPTLQRSQAVAISNGLFVRRLMPIECERLQGFPDNWTAMCSDSQRYKMLGNAVGVNHSHWLGARIVTAEARKRTREMMADGTD